jgi:hypothetical protein
MKDAYKFLTELVNQSRYEDCAKQAHETWRATKEEQGWGYGTERDNDLADELGEYVHSHFLAAQLPKGDTIRTRTDLVVYENLDQDTKSWDLNSSLEVVNYLRKEIKKLGGVK